MSTAALRVIQADLRSRPLNTALTGLVIAFALGALVITIHGRATLSAPFDRLFAATRGAHATVVARSATDAAQIARLSGVAEAEPPRPVVDVPVRRGSRGTTLGLEGIAFARARVEHPVILSGRATRGPGEIVLRRGSAADLGARPGDRVTAGADSRALTLRVV